MSDSTPFVYVKCPICGCMEHRVVRPATYPSEVDERDLRALYSASSHNKCLDQIVACQECSLVYLNPRPKEEVISSSYADAVDPTFVQQNAARIYTFERALDVLETRFGFSPADHPRVLDLGCAGGAFLHAAAKRGFRAVGIEPSRWLSDYARRELRVDARPGFLHQHKFPAGSFDVVSMWDVLEHLPDPSATLKTLRSLLTPDGFVVVNFPDISSLAARILGRRWPFWLSVHLTYYTRATIRRQFEITGFRIIGMLPHWQSLPLGYALERASLVIPALRFLARGTLRIGIGHLTVRYNMGQTMVVARALA